MLLQNTNRLSEAEPLMRRALAITEASYGKDHPDVAIVLSNLARLLQDTNRLSEAEPLMNRSLEIFIDFSEKNGYAHPKMQDALNNYRELMMAMGLSEKQAAAKLRELAPEMF